MSVAALRPLRHRGYALVWSGSLVSNIGTWMQTVAVGALVTDVTRNPVWTAVAFVAGFLPMGVLAPVGGALADRLDRRRFAIMATAVEAALAATLAGLVAAGRTEPAVVTGLVFLSGCVSALRLPVQHAMLPDLVPAEDIVGAVSLGSAQWNLGRVLGPALAGVVIVVGSFALAFAINALSFLAVIVALVLVPLPMTDGAAPSGGLLAHMRAGAAVVREEPGCRAALLLIALAAGLAAPFMALIPAMADLLVEGGRKALAGATGALTTAQGVGAVIGALVFPSLVLRFGRRRMITCVLLATPLALAVYAWSPSVPAAVASLLLVGGSYICVLSGLSAVVQLRAPAEYRGRVLSLFFATLSIVFPLGALVQGALAERVGLRTTTVAGGASLAAAVIGLRVLRPTVLAALDDPAEARPDQRDEHPPEAPIVTDAGAAQAAG
ncbi:MAG: MFS transporter [Actinobacteria bacterium]|nr:MFS transporter [Actinomycetota bacterium]